MGKKRKSESSNPAAVTIEQTQGLHSVADESRRKIFNAAAKALGHPEEQVKKSAWKKIIFDSCPDVFFRVEMPGVDPAEPVCFYMAKIPQLLQRIINTCPNYAALVDGVVTREPGICFQLICYNDEATAGNILQPESCKKASLWYFCLRELGWRHCDSTWHPLCFIQHSDFSKVLGGFGAIARRIVRLIIDQDLPQGFPIQLNHRATLLKCKLSWMISDLDSIRGSMNLKGSAAIRCCLSCRNCVKKNCGLDSAEFLEITSDNFEAFVEQTDSDIFQVWDNLLVQKNTLRKGIFQKKEQAAGFNVCEHAYLSDPLVREQLPPSSFLIDSMHLYWSNGIVGWEINSAYERWMATGIGNLQSFLQLSWCTTQQKSNTCSWRFSLAHPSMFSGAAYKGSASNLQAFLPLFHFFLEGCMEPRGLMTPELNSMRALRRIAIEMRKIQHMDTPMIDELKSLQAKHQTLTIAAFGYDHIRPKHHARLHHALQLLRAGFQVDCFPGERKHRFFKSHIGVHRFDTFVKGDRGAYSHLILRQVWQHHLEQLVNYSFSTSLVGKESQDPHMAQLLGFSECRVSNAVQHHGRTISKGDLLLGNYPGQVVCALQHKQDLWLRLKTMTMVSSTEFTSEWKRNEDEQLIPASHAGRSPMWWLEKDNAVFLCLH